MSSVALSFSSNMSMENIFQAAEGLQSLSLPSPSRARPSTPIPHDKNDDHWIASPFSHIGTMDSVSSPAPSINFSASPFPFSPPFSPAFTHGGHTPLDVISSCPSSLTRKARSLLSAPELFSPTDMKPSRRYPKRNGIELFTSNTETPSFHTDTSPFSGASPRSGVFMKLHRLDYKPIDMDDLNQENSIIDSENCSDSFLSGQIFVNNNIKAGKSEKLATSVAVVGNQRSSRRLAQTHNTERSANSTGTLPRSSSTDTVEDELEGENIPLPSKHNPRGSRPRSSSITAAVKPKGLVAAAAVVDSFASPDVVVDSRGPKMPTISPDMDPGENDEDELRQCNCKMSKCLKLYCECFQVSVYCNEGCRCLDCFNTPNMEKVRQEAIQATIDRNNRAFDGKITVKGHTSGCNCKKSQCLKKYCECFQGAVFCGPVCKCKACANFAGSETLETVLKEKEKKAAPVKDKERDSAKKRKLPEFEKEERNRLLLRSASKLPRGSCDFDGSFSETESTGRPTSTVGAPRVGTVLRGDGSVHSTPTRPIHRSPGGTETRPSYVTPPPSTSPDTDSSPRSGLQKKRRSHCSLPDDPTYAFFGPTLPQTHKLTALKVLEMLDGKDFYSMSVVDKLWCRVTMDDALWET